MINILVATDLHLGYLEKDPIRGEDSFATFNEVFQIANERKVRRRFLRRKTLPLYLKAAPQHTGAGSSTIDSVWQNCAGRHGPACGRSLPRQQAVAKGAAALHGDAA